MGRKGYSTVFEEGSTALARGANVPCSPKASRNIARTIKGMKVAQAKKFLEEVMDGTTAVPYTVRNHKVRHRKGRIGPGRFPRKAASRMLEILENAENNAEYKGLETDDLRIIHCSAYQGIVYPGWLPRAHGRASAFNEQSTNVELVVGKAPELDEAEEARAERREKRLAAIRRKYARTPAERPKKGKGEKPEAAAESVEAKATSHAEKAAGAEHKPPSPGAAKPAVPKAKAGKGGSAKPAEKKEAA